MRFFYQLYAYLWLQLRFKLTFFGITQRLTIDEIRRCFTDFFSEEPAEGGINGKLKPWIIASYQQRYNCPIFIETGTNQGGTLKAVAPLFRACYSIEIDPAMVILALKNLRNIRNTHIIGGDSSVELDKLLNKAHDGLFLWIDAHAAHNSAAPSPLESELKSILNYAHKIQVVLIDDANNLKISKDALNLWLNKMEIRGFSIVKKDHILRLKK